MFSNNSSVLLTVQLIELKFFNAEQTKTIKEIREILIEKKVKPPQFLFFPWNILVYSLIAFKYFLYFLIGYVCISIFFEGISALRLNNIASIISNHATFGIICMIVALSSFISIKIIDFFINKKVQNLKNTKFNTKSYMDSLEQILEPYQNLDLLVLLKANQDNLFGMVVLQFILVCIELGYIKYSDTYLKPFVLLKMAI